MLRLLASLIECAPDDTLLCYGLESGDQKWIAHLHDKFSRAPWTATAPFERGCRTCAPDMFDPHGPDGLVRWDGNAWVRRVQSFSLKCGASGGYVRCFRQIPSRPGKPIDFTLESGVDRIHVGSGGVIWTFSLSTRRTAATALQSQMARPTYRLEIRAERTERVNERWFAERFLARVEDAIGCKLVADHSTTHVIPRFHPAPALAEPSEIQRALAALHPPAHVAHRCGQCGMRVPLESTAAHMDAHFTKNRERRVSEGKIKRRGWSLPSVSEWTREPVKPPKPVAQAAVQIEGDETCVLCGTPFEPVAYDAEREEWVHPNTVSEGGMRAHVECARLFIT